MAQKKKKATAGYAGLVDRVKSEASSSKASSAASSSASSASNKSSSVSTGASSIAKPKKGESGYTTKKNTVGYNGDRFSSRDKTITQKDYGAAGGGRRWYSGETPTGRETVARMYQVAGNDSNRLSELQKQYEAEISNKGSIIYNPYTQATNTKAIEGLTALGYDVSDVDSFLANNKWLMNYARETTTGYGAHAPTKPSSDLQDAAYWYGALYDAQERTTAAETEMSQLASDVAYLVERGYSDDAILKQVKRDFSSTYKTLDKMDENRIAGEASILNKAVNYNGDDTIYGMIWAARNNDTSGDYFADAVKYTMGLGNQYVYDANSEAAHDPSNYEAYNPYAMGSTVESWNKSTDSSKIDDETLEANRWMLNGTDDEIKAWQNAYEANENTKAAKSELETLDAWVEKQYSRGKTADEICTQITSMIDPENGEVDSDYTTLGKMESKRKMGSYLSMGDSVDFTLPQYLAKVRAMEPQPETEEKETKVDTTSSAVSWFFDRNVGEAADNVNAVESTKDSSDSLQSYMRENFGVEISKFTDDELKQWEETREAARLAQNLGTGREEAERKATEFAEHAAKMAKTGRATEVKEETEETEEKTEHELTLDPQAKYERENAYKNSVAYQSVFASEEEVREGMASAEATPQSATGGGGTAEGSTARGRQDSTPRSEEAAAYIEMCKGGQWDSTAYNWALNNSTNRYGVEKELQSGIAAIRRGEVDADDAGIAGSWWKSFGHLFDEYSIKDATKAINEKYGLRSSLAFVEGEITPDGDNGEYNPAKNYGTSLGGAIMNAQQAHANGYLTNDEYISMMVDMSRTVEYVEGMSEKQGHDLNADDSQQYIEANPVAVRNIDEWNQTIENRTNAATKAQEETTQANQKTVRNALDKLNSGEGLEIDEQANLTKILGATDITEVSKADSAYTSMQQTVTDALTYQGFEQRGELNSANSLETNALLVDAYSSGVKMIAENYLQQDMTYATACGMTLEEYYAAYPSQAKTGESLLQTALNEYKECFSTDFINSMLGDALEVNEQIEDNIAAGKDATEGATPITSLIMTDKELAQARKSVNADKKAAEDAGQTLVDYYNANPERKQVVASLLGYSEDITQLDSFLTENADNIKYNSGGTGVLDALDTAITERNKSLSVGESIGIGSQRALNSIGGGLLKLAYNSITLDPNSKATQATLKSQYNNDANAYREDILATVNALPDGKTKEAYLLAIQETDDIWTIGLSADSVKLKGNILANEEEAEAIDIMLKQYGTKADQAVANVTSNVLTSTTLMGVTMAGSAVLTPMLGSTAGGLAASILAAAPEGAEMTYSLREQGVDWDAARNWGVLTAGISGATEALMNIEYAGSALDKQAIYAAQNDSLLHLLWTNPKQGIQAAWGLAKIGAVDAGGESLQEVTQALATNTVERVATGQSIFQEGDLKEYGKTALETLPTTVFLGMGGKVFNSIAQSGMPTYVDEHGNALEYAEAKVNPDFAGFCANYVIEKQTTQEAIYNNGQQIAELAKSAEYKAAQEAKTAATEALNDLNAIKGVHAAAETKEATISEQLKAALGEMDSAETVTSEMTDNAVKLNEALKAATQEKTDAANKMMEAQTKYDEAASKADALDQQISARFAEILEGGKKDARQEVLDRFFEGATEEQRTTYEKYMQKCAELQEAKAGLQKAKAAAEMLQKIEDSTGGHSSMHDEYGRTLTLVDQLTEEVEQLKKESDMLYGASIGQFDSEGVLKQGEDAQTNGITDETINDATNDTVNTEETTAEETVSEEEAAKQQQIDQANSELEEINQKAAELKQALEENPDDAEAKQELSFLSGDMLEKKDEIASLEEELNEIRASKPKAEAETVTEEQTEQTEAKQEQPAQTEEQTETEEKPKTASEEKAAKSAENAKANPTNARMQQEADVDAKVVAAEKAEAAFNEAKADIVAGLRSKSAATRLAALQQYKQLQDAAVKARNRATKAQMQFNSTNATQTELRNAIEDFKQYDNKALQNEGHPQHEAAVASYNRLQSALKETDIMDARNKVSRIAALLNAGDVDTLNAYKEADASLKELLAAKDSWNDEMSRDRLGSVFTALQAGGAEELREAIQNREGLASTETALRNIVKQNPEVAQTLRDILDIKTTTAELTIKSDTGATGTAGLTRAYAEEMTKLSKDQEKQMTILDALGKSVGVEIVVHPTVSTVEGAANGAYIEGNAVHVGLDALDQGYVQAGFHEVTHWVEKNNTKAFEGLKNVVKEALEANGADWNALVQSRIEQYAKQGVQISDIAAEGEIVAESCGLVLTDAGNMKKFAQENQSAFKTVMRQFTQFWRKLRSIAQKIAGKNQHGEMDALIGQGSALQKIYDNFMEAAKETGRAFQQTMDGAEELYDTAETEQAVADELQEFADENEVATQAAEPTIEQIDETATVAETTPTETQQESDSLREQNSQPIYSWTPTAAQEKARDKAIDKFINDAGKSREKLGQVLLRGSDQTAVLVDGYTLLGTKHAPEGIATLDPNDDLAVDVQKIMRTLSDTHETDPDKANFREWAKNHPGEATQMIGVCRVNQDVRDAIKSGKSVQKGGAAAALELTFERDGAAPLTVYVDATKLKTAINILYPGYLNSKKNAGQHLTLYASRDALSPVWLFNEDGEYAAVLPVRVPNRQRQGSGDTKYSLNELSNDEKYSYDALTVKPDMNVVRLDTKVAGKTRDEVIASALLDAETHASGHDMNNAPMVYVQDINKQVIVGKKGVEHGLGGARFKAQAPVIEKVGEILSNSISINEAFPKKDGMRNTWILMAVAQDNSGNPVYVRSIVNQSTGHLESISSLYAVNGKKDGTGHNNNVPNAWDSSLGVSSDSTISVADMLDGVKDKFSGDFSDDVIAKMGIERVPDEFTPRLKYSLNTGVLEQRDNDRAISYAAEQLANNGDRAVEIAKALAKYGMQNVTGTPQSTAEQSATNVNTNGISATIDNSGKDRDAANRNDSARTGSESGEVRNPVQILRELTDSINVGYNPGGQMSAGGQRGISRAVRGFYNHLSQGITSRTTEAGDLAIGLHEFGHAMQERLAQIENAEGGVGLTANDQMINALPQAFRQSYGAAEIDGEAVAEFVCDYMYSRDLAVRTAGEEYVKNFERMLRSDPALLSAMTKARDQITLWSSANTGTKIKSMISETSTHKQRQRGIGKLLSAINRGIFDYTAPAKQVSNDLHEAALWSASSCKRADRCLTADLINPNGVVIGDGLAKRLADTGVTQEQYEDIAQYALARHAIDRNAQGLPVFDEHEITDQDLRDYCAEVEQNNPAIVRAADALTGFWNDFFDAWYVETGMIDRAAVQQMRKMYPHYVPTFRVQEENFSRHNGAGSTFDVRAARGSSLEVINPIYSLVNMTQQVVNTVSQNELMRAFHAEMQQGGYDWLATQEAADMQMTHVNTGRVEQMLADMYEGITEETGMALDPAQFEDMYDAIQNLQEQWRSTGTRRGGNIVSGVDENGQRFFYRIKDKGMFELLSGSANTMTQGLALVRGAKNAFTKLTTGANPLFAAKNAIRDFQNSVNTGTWAVTYADGAVKWARALYEVVSKGSSYQEYMNMGGGGSTRYTNETNTKAKQLLDALFTNGKKVTPKKAINALVKTMTLSELNDAIETTSRLAEYMYGRHDTETFEGRREAFMAAQDVTTNFNTHGAWGFVKAANAVIPFCNATLQGVAKDINIIKNAFNSDGSIRARSWEALGKTALNVGMTAALQAAILGAFGGGDDDDRTKEEYAMLSEEMRTGNLIIPIPKSLIGKSGFDRPYLRIPIAQSQIAQSIYAAGLEMFSNLTDMDEMSVDMYSTAKSILANSVPDGSIFDTMIDAQNNTTWYGGSIVNSYTLKRSVPNQYNTDTIDLFKDLSSTLYDVGVEVSPAVMQYVAEQYSGIIGKIMIPALSGNKYTGERSLKQSLENVGYSIAKNYTIDPITSSDISSNYSAAKSVATSIQYDAKNGDTPEALSSKLDEYDVEEAVELANEAQKKGGIFYDADNEISEMWDGIGLIQQSDLSDSEKAQQIREIRYDMNKVMQDALDEWDEYKMYYIDHDELAIAACEKIKNGTK